MHYRNTSKCKGVRCHLNGHDEICGIMKHSIKRHIMTHKIFGNMFLQEMPIVMLKASSPTTGRVTWLTNSEQMLCSQTCAVSVTAILWCDLIKFNLISIVIPLIAFPCNSNRIYWKAYVLMSAEDQLIIFTPGLNNNN